MALIQKTGAIDVYFGESIEIVVADVETFPVAAAEEVLAEREISYSAIESSTF